jgi:hypothetical protein
MDRLHMSWCLRIRSALFLQIAVCLTCAAPLAAIEYSLKSVTMVKAPSVKERRVMYSLDLIFNSCPENYWIYYDYDRRRLVVDIYGGFCKVDPGLRMFRENLFKGIDVINQETLMSMSKKQAKVYIGADPAWHFEAGTINSNTIRITAWKFFETPKTRTSKRIGPLAYILTGAGALVIAFILVLVAAKAGD